MGDLGVTSAGAALVVDLDKLVGTHACVVANSGGGKSGLIRRLLETTHGRIQHIVLDVEDEFYTLRQRFDYVIAGGEGGDAPAAPANAAQLAQATLEHGFSLIAQLNDLGADGAPEFVGAFLGALMAAPRDLWRPVLVVIDETQRFAPRQGDTAASGAVKDLLARGRKRGFTGVLASQSLPEIDPRVRGLTNNWLLGRAGTSLDRKTVAAELGFAPSSAGARALGGLQRQFWGYGPAISPEPVLIHVAEVETAMPRPGQAKVPTPPPAGALKGILAGLAVPEVQAEAPAAGERRASADEIARADRAGFLRGLAEGEQRGEARGIALGITRAQQALAALRVEQPPEAAQLAEAIPAPAQAPALAARPSKPRPAAAPPTATPSAERRRGKLAALDAIAWWRAAGFESIDRPRAALVAGLSPKASTFGVYVAELAKEGLVSTGSGTVALTPAGVSAAQCPPKPKPAELRAFARALLRGAEARTFDIVTSEYPQSMRRAEIADAQGLSRTASTLGVYVGALSSYGFVTVPAPGHVRASDWLFPEREKRRA